MCTVRILEALLKSALNILPGFDLSAMATDVYEDAIVDVVGPETLVSEPYIVKVGVNFRFVLCLLM